MNKIVGTLIILLHCCVSSVVCARFYSTAVAFQSTLNQPLVGVITSRPRLTNLQGPAAIAILVHGQTGSMNADLLPVLTNQLLEQVPAIDGVLRLDFTGHGASAGRWEYGNYAQEVTDLHSCIVYLASRGMSTYATIGHSMGANVVLLHGNAWPNESPRIVSMSSRYNMTQGIFTNSAGAQIYTQDQLNLLESQGWFLWYSSGRNQTFNITRASLDERLAVNMDVVASISDSIPVLITQGTADATIPPVDANSLGTLIPHAQLSFIQGASHNYDPASTEVELANVVSTFLGGANATYECDKTTQYYTTALAFTSTLNQPLVGVITSRRRLINLQGPAAVAILVHGQTGTMNADLLPLLNNQLLEQTPALDAVLRLDFTGHGASAGQWEYGNYAQEVADMHSCFTYLASRGMAVYATIGHSMGANVVLLHGHYWPAESPRIVSMSSRWNMTQGIFTNVAGAVIYTQDQLNLLQSQGWFLWYSAGRNQTFNITRASLDERLAVDMTIVSSISDSIPVLLTQGTSDATIPPADATYLKEDIPHAQLTFIQGASHNYDPASTELELANVVAIFLGGHNATSTNNCTTTTTTGSTTTLTGSTTTTTSLSTTTSLPTQAPITTSTSIVLAVNYSLVVIGLLASLLIM